MNTSDYEVLIQGEHVQDDGLQIELGALREDQACSRVFSTCTTR